MSQERDFDKEMGPQGNDPTPEWWYRLHAAADALAENGCPINADDVRFIAASLLDQHASKSEASTEPSAWMCTGSFEPEFTADPLIAAYWMRKGRAVTPLHSGVQQVEPSSTSTSQGAARDAYPLADALYNRGYQDARQERDQDARGCTEWQIVVDAIGAATPAPAAPKACNHERREANWRHVECLDCGAVYTGNDGNDWGIAAGKWFKSLPEAEFYKKNGRYPEGAGA